MISNTQIRGQVDSEILSKNISYLSFNVFIYIVQVWIDVDKDDNLSGWQKQNKQEIDFCFVSFIFLYTVYL